MKVEVSNLIPRFDCPVGGHISLVNTSGYLMK